MALERVTRHLDTDVFIAAARELPLELTVIDAKRNFLRIEREGRVLFLKDNVTSMTNAALRQVAASKVLVTNLLKEKGLPVPEGKAFPSRRRDAIAEFTQSLPAAVIKPNSGSLERGVCLKPQSREEIDAAVDAIESYRYREVLVEPFVYGDSYRALVHDGDVLDIIRFERPSVVGDGEHSVAELVDAKSQLRRAMRLPALVIDEELLAVEGVRTWEVLPPGYHCTVHRKDSLSIGGEIARIDPGTVPEANLQLFRDAADACFLDLCGIDFISLDIRVPYSDNGAAINEVNASPDIYIHYYAEMHEDLSVPTTLLSRYFGL